MYEDEWLEATYEERFMPDSDDSDMYDYPYEEDEGGMPDNFGGYDIEDEPYFSDGSPIPDEPQYFPAYLSN